MNNRSSVAELRAAFDNVLARLPLFDEKRPVSVFGMALPLGVEGTPPTRLMVFPLGEPPSNDERKWRFTKEDLAKAVEAFRARTEPMPILYDHGKDPAKGNKAAGWVDSVELAADGLYANVRWTEQARTEIRSGEWGFRSPGWNGEEDPLGFIYAGPLNEMSLVNNPAIGGMLPVAASKKPVSDNQEPNPSPLGEVVSNAPAPPAKEKMMANEVTAAKKAAAAPDSAAVLEVLRNGFPDMFGAAAPDEMLAEYFGGILSGANAPADPTMPADAKPAEAPAIPLFSSAEDEAKKVASATAPAKTDEAAEELKTAKEQIAAQEARIKALEARELSGKIINQSAADRKGTPDVPSAPNPRDYVGAAILAYSQERAPIHKAAIAYIEKAQAEGKRPLYREAVVAVTRRKSA